MHNGRKPQGLEPYDLDDAIHGALDWGNKRLDDSIARSKKITASNDFYQKAEYYLNNLSFVDKKKGDISKVVAFYEKCIKENAAENVGLAYNNLACLYILGRGVTSDYKKALEYFTIAADKNLPEAFNNLGLMHLKGLGIEQNPLKAMAFFSRAKTCPAAMYHLGYCYDHGEGVSKDYLQAKNHYDSSINASDSSIAGSFFNLSLLYSYGLGVQSDFNRTSKFFYRGLNATTQHIRIPIMSINVPTEQSYLSPCSIYAVDQRMYLFGMSPRTHVIRYENFINASELNRACFTNDIPVIESQYRIVDKAATKPSENGDTPLILAILGCNEYAVKLLLERGEDPNIGYYLLNDETILSCMQLAILLGHSGIRKLLQEANAEFYPKSFAKLEAPKWLILYRQVHLAIRMHNEEMVKLLLQEGTGVNLIIDNTKITPIMLASVSGSPRIVQILLDAGANPNHTDTHDESALGHAARSEDPDVLKVLLQSKNTEISTYDFFDDSHQSPFGIAIGLQNEHLVKIFLQNPYYAANPFTHAYYVPMGMKKAISKYLNPEDPNTRYDKILNGDDEILENEKDMRNVRVFEQISSLSYATSLGNENIIKLLIDAFLDLKKHEADSKSQVEASEIHSKTKHEINATLLSDYSTDTAGKTAFMVAAEKGLLKSLEYMMTHLPFNHHKSCKSGKTALHYAVLGKSTQKIDTVIFLLKRGFSYKEKDNKGQTPLAYASLAMQKYDDMIEPSTGISLNFNKTLEFSYEINQAKCILSLLLGYKLTEHLNPIFEQNSIKLSEDNIAKEISELCDLIIALKPKITANDTIKIDVSQFPISIISKECRRKIPGYLAIKEKILDLILFKYISEKNNKKQAQPSTPIGPNDFLNLIWQCSSEKSKYEKCILDKRNESEQKQLAERKKKIESDLFWLKDGLRKYCDMQLNINAKRKEASRRLENITKLSVEVLNNTFGANKLRVAEEVFVQISSIFDQLQAKQLSFDFAADKLSPQIAAALKADNLKIANRLFHRLQKLDIYCRKLGENLKDHLRDLQSIEEDLESAISREKHIRSIQEERLQEIRTRQNKALAAVFQKFAEAEANLQHLRYACKERLKAQNARSNQKQSAKQQLTVQQKQLTNKQEQLKVKQKQHSSQENKQEAELKRLRDLEVAKMAAKSPENTKGLSLLPDNMLVGFKQFVSNKPKDCSESVESVLDIALRQASERPQSNFKRSSQDVQLSDFIEPKRKARDELVLLLELIQEIAFSSQEKSLLYCRIEQAAILGVMSRAMECYKNINAQALGQSRRKNNIFADLARIFRDTVFHNHDDKLFKKPSEDSKKNAELHRRILSMACNLLSFLNDPKWQKQSIGKEDLLKAFPADNEGNQDKSLFLKIIGLPIPKKPTVTICKEQILLGWKDYNEFRKAENIPDKIHKAAMGFCAARIGTFGSELVKRPNDEDGDFRRMFNNLRRGYKIPLGRFIQDGVNFRHVLKNITEIVCFQKAKKPTISSPEMNSFEMHPFEMHQEEEINLRKASRKASKV